MRFFNLPQETLVYLRPTRYCEVDSELANFAWANFNTTPLGWSWVQGNQRLRSRAYSVRLSESKNDADGARRFPRAGGGVPQLHTPRGQNDTFLTHGAYEESG